MLARAGTKDRRADSNDRRAFLNRDLEVVAHTHRQFPQEPWVDSILENWSRISRRRAKKGRARSASSDHGGSTMSPQTLTAVQLPAASSIPPRVVDSRAMFGHFTSKIELHHERRTGIASRAASSRRFNRSTLSTEWIHANACDAIRALLD